MVYLMIRSRYDSTSIKKTPPTCTSLSNLLPISPITLLEILPLPPTPHFDLTKPFILRKKHKKACVVPRPIGWISTRSPKGKDNLAPYSQFNNLTFDPPYVMFSSNRTPEGKRKDTVINAESTGK
jgi:hypothetical protein